MAGTYLRIGDGGGSSPPVAVQDVNIVTSIPLPRSWVLDDSTDSVTVTQGTNPWAISAVSLPLPTGASTSALQIAGNASLVSIDSKLTSPLTVTATNLDIRDLAFATDKVDASGSSVSVSNFPATQPISGSVTVINAAGASAVNIQDGGNSITVDAVSLPLPTGASTSALQTTANTSLSSIDSKLTSPITVTPTAFFPVDQGQPALPSDAWYVKISDGTNNVFVSANRLLVDGSGVTQPISAVSLPLPTGAATSALQTTGNASLASIDAGIPAALGQTTMANSMPVVIASDQSSIPVSISTPTIRTYSSGSISVALAALTTDFFTITGSGTQTIKITRIGVYLTGGGLTVNAQIVKRSTANTLGTSSVLTNVPNDSNFAAATATVRTYTANPTLGTLVGIVRAKKVVTPLATSTTDTQGIVFEFGEANGAPIVLRGTSQVLAVNLNGVTGATNASVWVEWTEE